MSYYIERAYKEFIQANKSNENGLIRYIECLLEFNLIRRFLILENRLDLNQWWKSSLLIFVDIVDNLAYKRLNFRFFSFQINVVDNEKKN